MTRRLLMSALFVTAACGAAARSNIPKLDGPAPDFSAKRLDGTDLQFATLRGRVVVLDIWAAWCEGCEKELPVLDALASRLLPIGATVVSITIDEQPDKALKLLRERSWTMITLYDSTGRVGDAYEPPQMPAVFVIDREGVIRDVRYSLKPKDIAEIEARVRTLSQ